MDQYPVDISGRCDEVRIMLYSNTNYVASGCREAYRLHEQMNDASTTILQQTSLAYHTRTCLFVRLHRCSTNNLSRMESRKHYHYPKRHSTHIVAQRIFRFAQKTTIFEVSLRARRNRSAWTYRTVVPLLRLGNFIVIVNHVVCLIWRQYYESSGSRRQ
jgi:hypothetical protein